MHHREKFPILETTTYLASHSLGAVPRQTEESLRQYYREWATQGIAAWDGPWWNIISRFGNTISDILHAPRGTVVPMENVTRGFAAIASALDWSGKRNKVVMTDLEFLTSYPFWQSWAAKFGGRVEIVKSPDGITVPTEKLLQAIDSETLIVPTSQVYFRSGALQDLKAVSVKAHSVGAYVLGDGYQSVGIVPMNLRDMGIDFFVGGSHKWLCGGPGAGFLYVREDLIGKLEPCLTGWFGIHNPFGYEPGTKFKPDEGIMRFLAGTPSIPALYAAIEGVTLIKELGLEKIRSHSISLTKEIVKEAQARSLMIKTPLDPHSRSGMVCIDFDGAQGATEKLVAEKIMIDYRPNCGIRVSPHFYNTKEDLGYFWTCLDRVRSQKG